MVKYRRLTLDELEQLEDSFIRFLAAQSITGEDWQTIREKEPDRHVELIDQFSDVVIEKTLHNVHILEHRTSKRILFFQFLDHEAKLYGLEWERELPIDLAGGFAVKDLVSLMENTDYKYSVLSGKRPYEREKKMEIFSIIEKGAQIPANKDLFNFVLKYIKKNH
jgi:hypothetical protein